MIRRPPRSPLFPYTPLFRSHQFLLDQVDRSQGRRARHGVPAVGRAVRAHLPGHEVGPGDRGTERHPAGDATVARRSEEHTSELQSPCNLVCRLLLEKKNEQDLRLAEILRRIADAEALHHRPVEERLRELGLSVPDESGLRIWPLLWRKIKRTRVRRL